MIANVTYIHISVIREALLTHTSPFRSLDRTANSVRWLQTQRAKVPDSRSTVPLYEHPALDQFDVCVAQNSHDGADDLCPHEAAEGDEGRPSALIGKKMVTFSLELICRAAGLLDSHTLTELMFDCGELPRFAARHAPTPPESANWVTVTTRVALKESFVPSPEPSTGVSIAVPVVLLVSDRVSE